MTAETSSSREDAATRLAPGAPASLADLIAAVERAHSEHRVAFIAAGDEKEDRDVKGELATSGRIELLGQTIHARLFESWGGVKLVDVLARSPRRVLLVQLDRHSELRPEYRKLVARLEEAGCEVTARPLVSPQAWWFLSDDERPEHLYSGLLVDWLCETFEGGGVG